MKRRPSRDSEGEALLAGLLPRVSRSFHLTLRALPRAVRRPVSVAYLLARTSDTIADTRLVDPGARRRVLEDFGRRVAGEGPAGDGDLRPFLEGREESAERSLLERAPASLRLLEALEEPSRQMVRQVLATILGGQMLDLERFGRAGEGRAAFLETEAELEDYTYRVAGCVGEFWTRICYHRLLSPPARPPAALLRQGASLGQGLQMINILRDAAQDRLEGRCYLPREAFGRLGVPESAWSSGAGERLRPLIERYRRRTRSLLDEGIGYLEALPRRWMRVHLACAWPILIGRRTLDLLPVEAPLDPRRRARVPRRQVRWILAASLAAWPFAPLWRRLLEGAGERSPA